jgi:hypothetical protein
LSATTMPRPLSWKSTSYPEYMNKKELHLFFLPRK